MLWICAPGSGGRFREGERSGAVGSRSLRAEVQEDNVDGVCSYTANVGSHRQIAWWFGHGGSQLEDAYRFCHNAVMHYVFVLPEREDCAAAFGPHLRDRAGSDDQLKLWCNAKPAYIKQSARNWVLDWRRALRRRRETLMSEVTEGEGMLMEFKFPDPDILPADAQMRREFWQQITFLCTRLSRRSLDILLRCYHDGQSHAEIAADLGLTVDAVSQIVSRSLKFLRRACVEEGVTCSELALPPSIY